jgi:hypothetical protein
MKPHFHWCRDTSSLLHLWIFAPTVTQKSRLSGVREPKVRQTFGSTGVYRVKIALSAIFWGFTREAQQTPGIPEGFSDKGMEYFHYILNSADALEKFRIDFSGNVFFHFNDHIH